MWARAGLHGALGVLFGAVLVHAASGDDDDEAGSDPWYLYAIIPPVAGIVGYATNVIALRMTFWPLEFMGLPLLFLEDQPVGLFGWQGIIPAKAGKMAAKATDIMMNKLFDVQEIFMRLDPARCSELLRPGLMVCIKESVTEIGRIHMPVAFSRLPVELRQDLERRLADQSSVLVTEMMKELQEDVESVIDVKHMVVNHFELHKELLVRMFKECGKEEFIFIERSGFIFGFMFGIVQMTVWYFYPASWVLPVAGFLVGWLTNFLALKMIFEPVEPTPFCGIFTLQGLFLLRQVEVSAIFASINAKEVLTAERMWREILYGRRSDKFEGLVRKYTVNFADQVCDSIRPAVLAYIGEPQFRELRDRLCDLIVARLPSHVSLIYDYSDKALDIETELRVKMEALPSRDFEQVLHPVFQEDEIKLIAVGGVLGAMVGFFQLLVVFA